MSRQLPVAALLALVVALVVALLVAIGSAGCCQCDCQPPEPLLKPTFGVGGCDEGGNIVLWPGSPDPYDHRFGNVPLQCSMTEEGELECPSNFIPVDENGFLVIR